MEKLAAKTVGTCGRFDDGAALLAPRDFDLAFQNARHVQAPGFRGERAIFGGIGRQFIN
jgi:hypothetical protein